MTTAGLYHLACTGSTSNTTQNFAGNPSPSRQGRRKGQRVHLPGGVLLSDAQHAHMTRGRLLCAHLQNVFDLKRSQFYNTLMFSFGWKSASPTFLGLLDSSSAAEPEKTKLLYCWSFGRSPGCLLLPAHTDPNKSPSRKTNPPASNSLHVFISKRKVKVRLGTGVRLMPPWRKDCIREEWTFARLGDTKICNIPRLEGNWGKVAMTLEATRFTWSGCSCLLRFLPSFLNPLDFFSVCNCKHTAQIILSNLFLPWLKKEKRCFTILMLWLLCVCQKFVPTVSAHTTAQPYLHSTEIWTGLRELSEI